MRGSRRDTLKNTGTCAGNSLARTIPLITADSFHIYLVITTINRNIWGRGLKSEMLIGRKIVYFSVAVLQPISEAQLKKES